MWKSCFNISQSVLTQAGCDHEWSPGRREVKGDFYRRRREQVEMSHLRWCPFAGRHKKGQCLFTVSDTVLLRQHWGDTWERRGAKPWGCENFHMKVATSTKFSKCWPVKLSHECDKLKWQHAMMFFTARERTMCTACKANQRASMSLCKSPTAQA